jgi:membrane-associated phospholipid phosphatase
MEFVLTQPFLTLREANNSYLNLFFIAGRRTPLTLIDTQKNSNTAHGYSFRNATFVLIPAVLWIAAICLRPIFVDLRCGIQPKTCTPSSVFWLDRFSIQLNNSNADGISFLAQNVTGILSFAVVFALCLVEIYRLKGNWLQSFRKLTLWIKAVLWTGLLTEVTRLLVQRPRPFVYGDPSVLGMNPAHYTSFFSGHTSFATASGIIAILLLHDQKLPSPIFRGFAVVIGFLILTTGICRILSGRHFLTDVLTSVVVGGIVSYLVYRRSIIQEKRMHNDN